MAFKQLQSGAKSIEKACFSAISGTNTKKGHITASFSLYNHHPIDMECTFRLSTTLARNSTQCVVIKRFHAFLSPFWDVHFVLSPINKCLSLC